MSIDGWKNVDYDAKHEHKQNKIRKFELILITLITKHARIQKVHKYEHKEEQDNDET